MNILIIEDEENAIQRLESLLKKISTGIKISGICHSIQESLAWLDENETPHLILSDVQLSDGLSFDIVRKLKKKIPVIFISAYDSYAIEAFKVEGLHYLLKPIKLEELQHAIERYVSIYSDKKPVLESPDAFLQDSPQKYQERFIVKSGAKISLLHDTEIAHIYTENKVVYIRTFENNKFVMDLSLESFETLLNPELFFRINRQFIINLKAIKKMVPASKQRIELTLEPASGYETITSFERTPQFRKWLLGQPD